MDLEKAINKLYNIIALDKTLRNEILKEVVEEDEAVCFLLSIGQHFYQKGLSVTRGGSTVNIDYQLGKLLESPKDYWEFLGLKEQVVMKELLTTSNIFDTTIFYAHGKQVFSKKEILKYFNKPPKKKKQAIPYLLVDSPKYYWVSMGKRVLFNNTPKGMKRETVYPYCTALFNERGKTLAYGPLALKDYMLNSIDFKDVTGDFKFSNSVANIQHIINRRKGDWYALVFHQDGILTLRKALIKRTYGIIDLIIDDSFEVTGIWYMAGEYTYSLKCNIPQTMIDNGIDKYTITIECNEQVNGKLNNVRFIKFNKKETK